MKKLMQRIKILLNVPRRRLAWLLIGYALNYRLSNIEKSMDLFMAKHNEMEELSAKEPQNKDYADESQRWMDMYWRYYEQHSELAAFASYLRD